MKLDFEAPAFLQAEKVRTKSGWEPTLEYNVVQQMAALLEMRDTILGSRTIEGLYHAVAYDTETSGLKVNLGARAIGHAFAAVTREHVVTCWYIPVRHIGPANENAVQLDPLEVARIVDEILNVRGDVLMHHAKFDIAMARADGVKVPLERRVIDIGVLATAANENEPSFKLKRLAALYCTDVARTEEEWLDAWMKKDARELKLSFKKRSKKTPDVPTYLERFGYARTPILLAARYACRDVFYTLYLFWMRYRDTMVQHAQVVEREHKIMWLLHEMEWTGLPANAQEIKKAQALATEDLEYWLGECRTLSEDPNFELRDAYLVDLLFVKMQLPPPKETKGGKLSVDKEARSILQHSAPHVAPLLRAIDRAKSVEKIKSTYSGSFHDHYSETTGCIHPTYNQIERREEGGVPVTGRLSSADPNAQNCEKKAIHLSKCDCKKCIAARGEQKEPGEERSISVRRYFYVPKDYIRFFFDFSQIELRVLAWFSRDPRLLECYANDLDVHAITSELVTSGDRDIAKQVNFGNSYGMTEIGLAKRMAGYAADPAGTRARAKLVLEAFFRTYWGIPRFRDSFAREARRNGCAFVNPFGRPRRIPELGARESWIRERGERMMMSSIISGTAADIMKESMLRCDDLLKVESPQSRLSQTIHDELIFDIHGGAGWASLIPKIKARMEDWPMFSDAGVPIKVGIKYSVSTWEDAKSLEVLSDGRMRFAA